MIKSTNGKDTSVSFTGHRNLPNKQEELLSLVKKICSEIQDSINKGYCHYIVGGAVGFDLLCGKLLVDFRNAGANITIEIAAPFVGQDSKYYEQDKLDYRFLLEVADKVTYVNEDYRNDCYRKRNQYMIENSSKVIAYYNGTIRSGTGQAYRVAQQESDILVNLYEF